LIAIESAALSYQSFDFKIFGRLTVLRSTPFVFLDRELGDLRSNFGDASSFIAAKYPLPLRTKHPPLGGSALRRARDGFLTFLDPMLRGAVLIVEANGVLGVKAHMVQRCATQKMPMTLTSSAGIAEHSTS
jgi:hypothetical protein